MYKLLIWEGFTDYADGCSPAIELENVKCRYGGTNDCWYIELTDSSLVLPKGDLVIKEFQTTEEPQ